MKTFLLIFFFGLFAWGGAATSYRSDRIIVRSKTTTASFAAPMVGGDVISKVVS